MISVGSPSAFDELAERPGSSVTWFSWTREFGAPKEEIAGVCDLPARIHGNIAKHHIQEGFRGAIDIVSWDRRERWIDEPGYVGSLWHYTVKTVAAKC